MSRHFAAALLLLALAALLTLTSAGRVRSTKPIFSARPQQYASKFLKAIEPLQAFHVTHSDDALPLAGFHPDAPAVPKPEAVAEVVEEAEDVVFNLNLTRQFDSALPDESSSAEEEEAVEQRDVDYDPRDLEHWTVNGPPHAYHKGHPQLYPDKIQLQFVAFGERVLLELHIMRDLFNEQSEVTLMEGGRVVSSHPHVLQSYWATLADGSGWASATLHRDGRFQAVVHRDGETLQVDPVEIHQQDMDEQAYERLHEACHHHTIGHPGMRKGLVVHRHADFVDISQTHRCGGVRIGEKAANGTDQIVEEGLMPFSATARRLLQSSTITAGYGNFPRSTSGLTAWTNCYFGDSNPQRIAVGFAVDTGMYEIWGSVAGVQQYIAWQMSVLNLVYLSQLRMFLTISDILIESTISPQAAPWNDKPPAKGQKCPITINTKLNTLSAWRGSKMPTKNAIWSLQTNCYPPAGTVGLAWIGVLCNSYYGTSISTYSSNQWLTTAHEIGHNFGAGHTFQLGQGSTGGIMDYGDGKLDGVFQFHSTYSKTDMCAAMGSTQNVRSFTPYCVAAYAPVCGNGVLEPGEACDDKSSCCGQPGSAAPCQLTTGAQCSGETPCCSACKFKPSSTTCLGGNGYCQNGFCAPSACTGYSGLSFCGMVSTNPCRQQCQSASTGICSSSYTSPNLNVPDGMVCNAQPFSTCRGGQCVPSGAAGGAVTYSWSTSAWSTCACTGTQTRAAYCVGSDGSVGAAGTQCSAETRPALSQPCTAPPTCATYSWQVSPWSTCSVDCGGGIQSAIVQCISSANGAAVADSSCTAAKPASTQACGSGACPTTFVYSDWSPCSVGCNGGVSTRTVACKLTQNGVQRTVPNDQCTGMQATSQVCNTQPCQAPGSPGITYTLTYGTWTTCTQTCGSGGSQTRPAFCVGSDGGRHDLSRCGCGPGTATAVCPGTVQPCNTAPCPSYAWDDQSWGPCSLPCGGGVQTRRVQCRNTVDNSVVADTNCVAAKPAGVQSCNTATCSQYKWAPDLWQACSQVCGGGTQTRAVNCISESNTVVAPERCTGTKPATEQACNVQSCPVFQWLLGPWSTCSAWCGGGTQTRSVRCVATGSLTAVAYANCDTSNIPPSAQYCNTEIQCPLNSDTQWVLSSWSDCSLVCGGDGIRNRTVLCQNSTTGAEVDPKYCPVDYIPEVTSVCEDISCPTYWYTSDWSACTSQCEGGTQTRRVECRYVNGGDQKIDDAVCTGTKPSETNDCNLFPCPRWVADEWGPCSTRCNDGLQARRVDCITWDNQNTTVEQCAGSPLPPRTQVCRNQPCPHWHRGPWTPCDAPCGSGNQTRELVCRMPHDDVWHGQVVDDESLCPALGAGDAGDGVGEAGVEFGKPPAWQLCNQLPCPTYYWDVDKWSQCSAECGGGSQEGTVVCRAAADKSIVDASLCLGDPPSSKRVCNEDPCPVYEWLSTDAWSNCTVLCGSGTQTRGVRCVNSRPAAWKRVPFEVTPDESLCAGQPRPPSIQPCSTPKSVCFGVGGQDTSVANGLCTQEGTCLCRAGWAGQYCEETPRITGVLTNGAAYSAAGIPFGDTLQVRWQSEGSLPYVSVLLVRNRAADPALNWPVPSYIARDILNTGSYTWSVGDFLKDLESGDGFSVRVWFSSRVWGETEQSFTIADPCDYKSCGVHGTCGVGGVCQCVKGYSGADCSLGPCERARCSTSYGSCNNDDYIGLASTTSETVGVCLCGQNANGYFDGFQCRTPPGCTPKCKNGADLFNVIIDLNGKTSEAKGECGVCGCMNMWGGDDCGTCGLACLNGGKPNDNCTACDCSAAVGYIGSTCGCKYYDMQLRLDLESTFAAPSEWINDPISNARFARTLAIDLALASGQSTGINTQINVVQLRLDPDRADSVLADVQFALECPVLSEENIGGGASVDTEQAKVLRGISTKAAAAEGQAFHNLLSPRTVKDARSTAFFPLRAAVEAAATTGSPSFASIDPSVVIVDGRPTLLSVYNILAFMFEDLSSPVYRGVITSSVSHAAVLRVSDPSGQDSPRTPAEARDPFQAQASEGGGGAAEAAGKLSTGAIIGIAVGGAVLVACLVLAGVLFFRRRARQSLTVRDKPRLANQHQPLEAGTELASSQGVTPADTPHHTPPGQTRTLPGSIDIPAQAQKRNGGYLASPSGPIEEEDELSVQHVNIVEDDS